MKLNKAACVRVCVCVPVTVCETEKKKARVTVCYSLMRSWSVIPWGGGPI